MAFARTYELPTNGYTQELGCYDGMGSLGARWFNPFRKGKKGQRGRKWMLGLAAVGAGSYFGGKKMGWWGSPSSAVGSGGPATYGPPSASNFMGPPQAPVQGGHTSPGGAIRIPKVSVSGGFLKSLFPAIMGSLAPKQPQAIQPMPQPKASPVMPIILGVGGIVALAVVVNIVKGKKKT